jgi:RimJ/RimL family protein N-acetyltransferase
MKDITIETDRFLLRVLTVTDVSTRYLDWINGSNKSKYISYASQKRTIEEVRTYVTQKVENDSTLFLGIYTLESQEHIGNIKYEPIDFKCGIAIMGILIGEDKWKGKCVAAEVIKSSSIWLKEMYDIKKIILSVDASNKSAIKAYKKVGFVKATTKHLHFVDNSGFSMVLKL